MPAEWTGRAPIWSQLSGSKRITEPGAGSAQVASTSGLEKHAQRARAGRHATRVSKRRRGGRRGVWKESLGDHANRQEDVFLCLK